MNKIYLILSIICSSISLHAQNKLEADGNVGVGTLIPYARLHVLTAGSSINATNQYTGDMVIEARPGPRNSTVGASLEFVIPANLDGNNAWGQGRIITVAGDDQDYHATGKMILGTRRLFDKLTGTGNTWNYGDDIVIDAIGNVGIGTINPREKLSVNGKIRSKEVVVEEQHWPDYVFDKDYKLLSLESIEQYILKYKHLPNMPSAEDVKKNGQNLGEINSKLLKTLEELTLLLIEKDKQLKSQDNRIKVQELNAEKLQKTLEKIMVKIGM